MKTRRAGSSTRPGQMARPSASSASGRTSVIGQETTERRPSNETPSSFAPKPSAMG